MELVKNKASGKFFIVIDDTGDKYIKLITPEGKVKFLDRHLFEPQASADHKDSLYYGHLTNVQMDRYMEYEKYVNY